MPITDIAEIFRKEFGSALKVPGWLLHAGRGGGVNESAETQFEDVCLAIRHRQTAMTVGGGSPNTAPSDR